VNKSNERYLYIKNGDAALQVERIAALEGQTANGPDELIADFLKSVHGDPVLLLSIFKNSKKHIKIDNVEAICFPSRIDGLKILGTLFARTHFYIAGTLRALKFKPSRIICVRRGLMLWFSYLLGKIYDAPVVYVSHDRIKRRSSIAIVRMAYALDEYCMRRMFGCVQYIDLKGVIDTFMKPHVRP